MGVLVNIEMGVLVNIVEMGVLVNIVLVNIGSKVPSFELALG